MNAEHVILVDEADRETGTMEKIEAHTKGMLHRAFSILLFNSKGELLIQKRAHTKYHSAGLWTNTCCSHPLPGETMKDAIRRKLMQEMGIVGDTEFAFKFHYKVDLGQGLIENEVDHVFTGLFDGQPEINEYEVEEWKFAPLETLHEDVGKNPDQYTFWFKAILSHPLLKEFVAWTNQR